MRDALIMNDVVETVTNVGAQYTHMDILLVTSRRCDAERRSSTSKKRAVVLTLQSRHVQGGYHSYSYYDTVDR